MKILILLITFFITFPNLYAAEKDYQTANCKGITEYVLPNRTRVDCLTDTHAIEYDFGYNWAEAIGQSLQYAMWTGRRAGIVLILSDTEDRFLKRIKSVINHYGLPIDVWTVKRNL